MKIGKDCKDHKKKTTKKKIDFYLNGINFKLESAKCSSKSMIYYIGVSSLGF